MKKILLIIVLLTGIIYSQEAVLKDTTINNAQTNREQDQDILDLKNNITGTVDFQSQIDNINRDLLTIIQRLDIHDDSISVFSNAILALQSGGGIPPEPSVPTNLLATADNDTAKIRLTWDEPTSIYDSIYIYRDNVEIAEVDSGITLYTNTGLTETTIYSYKLRSMKRIGGLALFSDFSNISADTTFTTPPPPPSPSGDWTFDYLVSPFGGGDTLTLTEVLLVVVPGDTVFLAKGQYNIASGTIQFSTSGTNGNPIVFYGEHTAGYDPTPPSGTELAMFYNTTGTNGALNISGSYVEFHNVATYQAVGKQTYNVSGDYVIFDSCVIYTPDAIGTEHTVVVKPTADHFTLSNSYIYQSGRTAVWVEASATEAADYSLIEKNIFEGQSHHYAIQIMPLTNVASPPNNIGAIIRNNIFRDIPYSSALYLRNMEQFAIYNNIFIKAGGYYGSPINIQTHEFAPFDTVDAQNSIIAYNTYIAESYAGGAQEFVHHYGNMNNLKLYNNLCMFSSVKYVYRTGCAYNTIAAGHRWESDYNLFYAVDDATWTGTKNSVWYNSTDCTTTTYNWANTKSVLGFDANTIVGQLPTFVNSGTRDYRPLNASSPQVNAGYPITIANGFIMDILTDFNGITRSLTTPTIGCYEYVP